MFLAGERVEMRTLADALDISRTTLYRWVGEREQLMGEVLGGLVEGWLATVEPEVRGEGVTRFLDLLRRFLELAAAASPLTEFTQREPALALRVLVDRKGAVSERSNEALYRKLAEIGPGPPVPTDIADAIGLVARTLVWVNIATGQEPDIEGAVDLARVLLGACGLSSPHRA